MLLQISEPDSPVTNQRVRKRGLGIDLGTTNSLVATKSEQDALVLKGPDGTALLPSVVHFGDQVTVGNPALALAESDPGNTVVSAKRLMGRAREDLSHIQLLGLEDSDRLAFDTPRHSLRSKNLLVSIWVLYLSSSSLRRLRH